jgi:hypothetical protein
MISATPIRDQIVSRATVSQFTGQAAVHASLGANNANRLFRPMVIVLLCEICRLTSCSCKPVSGFIEYFRICELVFLFPVARMTSYPLPGNGDGQLKEAGQYFRSYCILEFCDVNSRR